MKAFAAGAMVLGMLLLPGILGAADNSDPVRFSNEMLEELERYRVRLEELESEYGPLDSRLLEPLDAMAGILIEQGDYEQALQVQQRHLQLMRTTLGLEHPDLIPAVRELIPTLATLGEYDDVADQLELIRVLTVANGSDAPEERLAVMGEQAQWLRLLGALGDPDRRVRNFFRAREVVEEMVDFAEDAYGEEDPRIVPWLYESALTRQQLVSLLNADDGFGGRTIDRLIIEDGVARLSTIGAPLVDSSIGFGRRQIPVVERGELLGQHYIREGMGDIRTIRDLYEEVGDREGEAMAKIYYADYQLIIDRGTAFREYREAQELLRDAGVPEADIEEFFEVPQVIPLPRFFSRFGDALAYLRQQRVGYSGEPDRLYLGEYVAWNDSAPMAGFPELFAGWGLAPEFNRVELEFNISSRGRVSAVDTLSALPDERRVRGEARRGVQELKFRPAMVNGRQERRRDVLMGFKYLD